MRDAGISAGGVQFAHVARNDDILRDGAYDYGVEARCITVYLQYNNLDLYSSYLVQP